MRLVIYLLLIFHCVTTQASTPVVRFEHLTIEDGLSQNSVLAILQDHQGFFWFATRDGLNRYDGYHFKHFHSNHQDSNSISGNFINGLYEDNQSRLWIGT